MSYTLGSLFDGSGGFPLAGSLCGIEPRWASEVEPYPIAVTRERFPAMRHLGDISKINGAEIEPVDIITFGSPCQDLSVAGKRAGLKHEANGDDETTRSGLFMEAVRIIKEMREATNGKYPTFALWENVPGAFSSNGGEDFRVVCEELIKIVEPGAFMPPVPQKGWAYADSYVGDGWSLSYRVFDAQYWGVPQRRRRIHLIVDFRGERAHEVLFEREGLRGYFAKGRTPRQGIAENAKGRAGADDREGAGFDRYNGALTGPVASTIGVNCGVSTGRNGVITPAVSFHLTQDPISIEEKTPCLGTGNPIHGQATLGVALSFEPGAARRLGGYVWEGVAGTLRAEAGDNRLACCYVLDDQGGQSINVRIDGKSPTLRAETHGNLPCVFDKETYGSGINASGGHYIAEGGPAPTLRTEHPPGVAVRYIVRRLTPTECARLQGFPDSWGHIKQKETLTDEEYSFWLEVRNIHAAINGKAVKEYNVQQMLTWYNKLWTDSAEYKMWGNGIALPPALYCMQGIVIALDKYIRETEAEDDDSWML